MASRHSRRPLIRRASTASQYGNPFASAFSYHSRSRSLCSGLQAAAEGLLTPPHTPIGLSPARSGRRLDSGYQSPSAAEEGALSLSGYGGGSRYPSSSNGSRTSLATPDPPTDYKELYEKERSEREKLAARIGELEAQMSDLRKSPSETTRVAGLAGLAERQRGAWERRVADLEEDVKELEKLRSDNARLKEENGALIRVISKLSK